MRRTGLSQRGNILILVALLLPVILGTSALVVDLGFSYMEKTKLQNAADAIVMAGAKELPTSTDNAVAVGYQYATKNNILASEAAITCPDTQTIRAVLTRTTPGFFSRIFNINNYVVQAAATARVDTLTGYNGIVPLAVGYKTFEVGKTYTLKRGAVDTNAYSGNFGGLSLNPDADHSGGNDYLDNLKYGYKGLVKVGDQFYTKTGNMVGPTVQGLQYRIDNNALDVLVPVIGPTALEDINGSKQVTIIGFAYFHLVSATGNNDKNGTITGIFQSITLSGTASDVPNPNAVWGAKLVE